MLVFKLTVPLDSFKKACSLLLHRSFIFITVFQYCIAVPIKMLPTCSCFTVVECRSTGVNVECVVKLQFVVARI